MNSLDPPRMLSFSWRWMICQQIGFCSLLFLLPYTLEFFISWTLRGSLALWIGSNPVYPSIIGRKGNNMNINSVVPSSLHIPNSRIGIFCHSKTDQHKFPIVFQDRADHPQRFHMMCTSDKFRSQAWQETCWRQYTPTHTHTRSRTHKTTHTHKGQMYSGNFFTLQYAVE